jgi:MFS transporter, DHA1 family, multidrug resistance protein
MTFAATFSSGAFAAVGPSLAADPDLGSDNGPQTAALATALFVAGFAAGPILFGAASEAGAGRKLSLFSGHALFVLSQVGVARAAAAREVLIWRLVGGLGASASPAVVGGYLADFLRPVERGVAVAVFAATTLAGPPVGAVVGGVLARPVGSLGGWRAAAWLSVALGLIFGVIGWLVIPETHVPVLLRREAQRLRLQTGNWSIHARIEENPVTFRTFVTRHLARAFVMLASEPILMLMTLYVSFTFGMVYFLSVVSSARV